MELARNDMSLVHGAFSAKRPGVLAVALRSKLCQGSARGLMMGTS